MRAIKNSHTASLTHANRVARPLNRMPTGAILSIAMLLIFTLAAWLSENYDAAAAAGVFLPILFHYAMWTPRTAHWAAPTPSLVVAGAYGVFFGSGLIKYWLDDRYLLFQVLPIPAEDIAVVIGSTSVITTCFVIGSYFGSSAKASGPRKRADSAVINKPFVFTAFFVGILAFSGAVLVIAGLGGVNSAASALGKHDRTVGISIAGSFGSSAWSVFAVPAVISLSVVYVKFRGKIFGYISLVQIILLSTIALYIFGSRLTLVLAFTGFATVKYVLTGTVMKARIVLAAFLVLMTATSFVISTRDDGQSLGDIEVLDALSYAVLDASMAAYVHTDELQEEFSSGERALTVLSTAFPKSSASALEVSEARVDVIVVRKIGNAAQASSSGIPPSLPTFLMIVSGPIIGAIFGLGLGFLVGVVSSIFFQRRSLLSALMSGLFVAFVLNSYKGGDILLDLGSEARRWAYLALIYGLFWFLFSRRGSGQLGVRNAV